MKRNVDLNWPLSKINHSYWDRIKLAGFFLNPRNRWSVSGQAGYTEQLQWRLAAEFNYQYCVLTSSGSTANTLLAMKIKHDLGSDFYKGKNKIVVSAVGWPTTFTPFTLMGFEPVFIDVEKNGEYWARPLMSKTLLREYLENRHTEVAAVFYTSLLGMGGENHIIQGICEDFEVECHLDSCEDTFGIDGLGESDISHWNYDSDATTSFYLAHEIQSCPELGAIFTNDKNSYEYYIAARNHGMSRHLQDGVFQGVKKPLDIWDNNFSFVVEGNNFRPSEINSYAALLNLKNAEEEKERRVKLARRLYDSLDSRLFYDNYFDFFLEVPFCLPIISKCSNFDNDFRKLGPAHYLKNLLHALNVEYRGVVGGSLLLHSAFKKYDNIDNCPFGHSNSDYTYHNGVYIGIPKGLTYNKVEQLAHYINEYVK